MKKLNRYPLSINGKEEGELTVVNDNELTALEQENAKLRAILDGDPHQTAKPEERREWRLSAVRYADKVEKERDELRERLEEATYAIKWFQKWKHDCEMNPDSPMRKFLSHLKKDKS